MQMIEDRSARVGCLGRQVLQLNGSSQVAGFHLGRHMVTIVAMNRISVQGNFVARLSRDAPPGATAQCAALVMATNRAAWMMIPIHGNYYPRKIVAEISITFSYNYERLQPLQRERNTLPALCDFI
jgi:hypothetical protein